MQYFREFNIIKIVWFCPLNYQQDSEGAYIAVQQLLLLTSSLYVSQILIFKTLPIILDTVISLLVRFPMNLLCFCHQM